MRLVEKIKTVLPDDIRGVPNKVWTSYYINFFRERLGLSVPDRYYIRRYLDSEFWVHSGVFTGMQYINNSYYSSLLPKIVGSYEKQIYKWLERLDGKYTHIVNIGCAEGYYAVGLARKYPHLKVLAYDLDSRARGLSRKLAEINNVHNLSIGNRFTRLPSGNVLVICDIEGAELDLLDPEKNPKLLKCDFIVECHDYIRPVRPDIIRRFRNTHTVTQQVDQKRKQSDYPFLKKLEKRIFNILTDEKRPVMDMVWLKLNRK